MTSKKPSVKLGVSESSIQAAIKAGMNIDRDFSERTLELIRGVRLHAAKLLRNMQADDHTKAQLGLGRSYQQAKVKFNVIVWTT